MSRRLGSMRVQVALWSALVSVLAAGPAYSAQHDFRDPADDAPARVDVRRVRVVHSAGSLRVAVHLEDYRGDRNGRLDSVTAYLDTDSALEGPEFLVRVRGVRYYFLRMRHWRTIRSPYSSAPYTSGCGGLGFRYDFDRDRVVFTVPRVRRCIGRPRDVRVSVVAAHQLREAGSGYVEDYAPAERQFYGWVHQS